MAGCKPLRETKNTEVSILETSSTQFLTACQLGGALCFAQITLILILFSQFICIRDRRKTGDRGVRGKVDSINQARHYALERPEHVGI